MKTKKSGVYVALTAVLLISAVLVTSCMDPLVPGGLFPKKESTDGFVPPPGKGYVTLNFGAGRTIRPASGAFVANAAAFTHFDVVFTPDSTSSTPGTLDNTNGIGKTYAQVTGTAFVLDPGDYNIEVWAYTVAHDTGTSAPDFDKEEASAYGMTALSVDASGVGTSSTITLKEITDSAYSGTGRLAWALSGTTGPISSALLTLTKYPDKEATTVTGEEIASKFSGISAFVDVAPGVYHVSLVLSGSAKYKPATIREVVYIYQGITSTWTDTTLAINRFVYDVTYTYGDSRSNDGKSIDGSAASDEVTHGALVTEPSGSLVVHSSDTDYEIEGWYEESAYTNKWVFTTQLLGDLDLFAKWEKAATYVTITWAPPSPTGNPPSITLFEVDPDDSSLTAIPGSTYTFNKNSPKIVRFQGPATGGSYSNYSWTVSTNGTLTSTNDYIDVDFRNIDFKISGSVRIDLSATHTTSGGELNYVILTVQ